MSEVYQCSKVGKSCIYGSKLSGNPICEYILIKHSMRDCPPEACDKYMRKKRRRRKKEPAQERMAQ